MTGPDFFLKLNDEITVNEIEKYNFYINKYLNERIPIQHILGYSYFYGYKLKVNKDVLIPRSETEELVGITLEKYDDVFPKQKIDIVDVGTGSGALAIALQKEESNFNMYAIDISEEALNVAKANALNNKSMVTFLKGDMLEPCIEGKLKFDIIVSNPPYIPEDEEVQDIVYDNEPHIALFGGKNGLYFIEKLLSEAKSCIKDKSIILFEHSFSKGAAIKELVDKYFPNCKYELIKDLNGKDRFTVIVND